MESGISNTTKSVSFDIKTSRKSNTRMSVSSDIQTPRGTKYSFDIQVNQILW